MAVDFFLQKDIIGSFSVDPSEGCHSRATRKPNCDLLGIDMCTSNPESHTHVVLILVPLFIPLCKSALWLVQ